MSRSEKVIHIWNAEFPNYPLTLADLKKPHSMIGAFIEIFRKLGFNIDAVMSPPPENERDEHTSYYWDLMPFINITRVINRMLSYLQTADNLVITFPLTVTHILQPDATTSHTLLLLLVNVVALNEKRLQEIEPFEKELFGRRDKVKSLEERKHRLLEMLNERAEEKGKRAEKIEKLEQEIKQLEDELRVEREAHSEESLELETVLEQNRRREQLLSQKRTQRDTLLAEVARMRELRVYDADDIMSQAEQATRNDQEAEEKLKSLKDTLMQKESALGNLQKIKPNLDQANTLLHDVIRLSENLKELGAGDLDTDSQESELDVLKDQLSQLQQQRAELCAAALELRQLRQESCARRHTEQEQLESALRETEDADRKASERARRAALVVEEIKRRSAQFEEEKAGLVRELELIKKQFVLKLGSYEDELLKKLTETKETIEGRLKGRRI